MTKKNRVAITTGDIDGIGSEITAKALYKIRPQNNTQFYLWRSSQMPQTELRLIDRQFKRITVHDWPSALRETPDDRRIIIDIESHLSPAKWVEIMAFAGHTRSIDALVTAPLSKTEILSSGLRDKGHTGILKRVTRTKNLYMSFLGKEFNVTLLTGHISIKKAYDAINENLLSNCITKVDQARQWLPTKIRHKPIALVGCNPHAGELGVIDSKEQNVYLPIIKKLSRIISLSQPLVPDVCFQKKFWKHYSMYIASYHDQGLIPFKMVHGANSGIQICLGLPFIRTSVDHGTAKDIFGKNKADSGSMENALKAAIKLTKNKPITW